MSINKTKNYFLIFITVILIIICSYNKTFADSINIGASPSFIKDINLSETEETSVKVTVTNTSSFANTLTAEQKKNFSVNIDLDIESDIIPKDSIILSENNFSLNYGEKKEIEVILPPSENFKIDKENKIYVTISGTTNESFNINYVPTIKVPLFVYTDDNLISQAQLNKLTITDKYELEKKKSNTNKKDSFSEVFFQKPIKIENFDDNKQTITYDIPKNKELLLKDCIVYSKEELNSKKYIYLETNGQSYIDMPIQTINFNEDNIEFIVNENSFKMFVPNDFVKNLIKIQMENIASIIKSPPSINYLIENINIYKNKDFTPTQLYLDLNMTNTGEKTLVPKGKITIMSSNNVKIKEMALTSNIINTGETKSSFTELPLSSMPEGRYKLIISTTLSNNETIEKTIYLNLLSFRFKLPLLIIAFILIILSLITLIISKLKKVKKNSKSKINEDTNNVIKVDTSNK